MPEDKITKGKRLLEEAKADCEEIIEKVQEFKRKYGPASIIFGCTLIEGQGARYAYGGPAGPRQNMSHILARLAEDEQVTALQGGNSMIRVTHQMPGKPS